MVVELDVLALREVQAELLLELCYPSLLALPSADLAVALLECWARAIIICMWLNRWQYRLLDSRS